MESSLDIGKRRKSKVKSSQKLPPLSTTSTKKLPAIAEASEENLDTLKEALEKEWSRKQIPEALQDLFRFHIYSLPGSVSVKVIHKELQNLMGNKSLVQIALRNVSAREESLSSIIEMIEYLQESPDWQKLEEVQVECAEMLHAHRMLSLSAVESIVKWREQLGISGHPHPSIGFLWEGENYLNKMRTDIDFLAQSEFKKIFKLEDKRDPMLLTPSQVPGKEKSAKNNYFVADGQVYVPVPSILMNRVKEAEAVIFEGCTPPPSYDKESELIAQGLLEELLHAELRKIAEEAIHEKGSQNARDLIYNLLLEEFLRGEANELINNRISEITFDKLLVEEIKFTVGDFINQQKTNKANVKISDKLFDDLLEIEILRIAAECINEEKANRSMKENITQSVYQSLVDSLFSELAIAEQVVGEKQAEMNALDQENTKISSDFAEEILDDFINSEIFIEIAYEAIAELEDELPERPEITYLQRKQTARRKFERKSTLDEIDIDFDIGGELNLEELTFKPLHVRETKLKSVVYDYYDLIPQPIFSIVQPLTLLMTEVHRYNNTCYYWLMNSSKVCGLLVYSENPYFPGKSAITIHHFSTISFSTYARLLKATEEFIWSAEDCQNIRYDMYNEKTDIPREIKLEISKLSYKWKTHFSIEDAEIIVYGLTRDTDIKPKEDLLLSSVSYLVASSSSVAPKEETPVFGINPSLIKATIGMTGKFPLLELEAQSKQQSELIDKLVGVIDSDTLVTENSEQMRDFLKTDWERIELANGRQAASINNLKIRWVSCTNTVHRPVDTVYNYLMFKTDRIEYRSTDSAEIFLVPTATPKIQAVFIRTIEPPVQDIDKAVANMLQNSSLVRKSAIQEVWVPAFNIEVQRSLPWMEGFHVPMIDGQDDSYVKSCHQGLRCHVDAKMPKDALVFIDKPTGTVFKNDFIFAVIDENADLKIEGPLFAIHVQEKDWVQVKN